MTKPLPSPDELRNLLRYDYTSGKVFWRERSKSSRRWNTSYAGKEAFYTLRQDGYVKGSIYNRSFLAHRVIWALCNGEWPKDQIDHINGDKSDNRIENLRVASSCENSWNVPIFKSNSSGHKGVCYNKNARMWHARITFNSKTVHLGYFVDINDAVEARRNAGQKYHREFCRN